MRFDILVDDGGAFVSKGCLVVVCRAGFIDGVGHGADVEVSSGRNMILSSFSRVIHGVRRLLGFLVCVISIVPEGAEARMRPIVSFCTQTKSQRRCEMARHIHNGERGEIHTGRSLFDNQFVTRFMEINLASCV